jgi:hypothetical protein
MMGKNCCPISRYALAVPTGFNRDVRIVVDFLLLGRRDQVGPTTPVTFGESDANADEFGEVETVPLHLPARRLVCRRRTPIGEVDVRDLTNQLGFDWLRLRCGRLLVTVGSPTPHKAILDELELNIGATGRAEPGRHFANKCEAVRVAFELHRAGSTATDQTRRWRRNPVEQHA